MHTNTHESYLNSCDITTFMSWDNVLSPKVQNIFIEHPKGKSRVNSWEEETDVIQVCIPLDE